MENRNGMYPYTLSPRGAESRTMENHHERMITTVDNNNDRMYLEKDKNITMGDYQFGLQVMIVKAMGIDDPSHRPFVFNRHYNVVYWVVPGEEVRTRLIEGYEPLWNERGFIFLNNIDDYMFLNVEVQRFNSINVDPGTSSGKIVVGRARIPFPRELYRKREGSYSLVRIDGENPKAEGQIDIIMRLEMFRLD